MQVEITDLKRKKICPILYRHEWDYQNLDLHSEFFRFCMAEMMRWQHRKGRGISYSVLSSLVSRLATEKGINRMTTSDIQLALKTFTNSGLYSKIEDLIANVEIHVGISSGHVIKHTLPTLCEVNEQTTIITWNDDIKSREDLRQLYETRVASVWAFYSINRYPTFYNLYREDNKIKHVRYRPNQFYVRDSRQFLLGMKDLIEDDGLYPAPLELCLNCNRRPECQTMKTRTKNWQKSW